VIMAPLFEKKRNQICAVWVTTSSSSASPFEELNDSTRKYDSLRGKYVAAYVDALRLCKRISILDNLMQSFVTSKRDVPSFYQASARAKGGIPETLHTRDSLLKGRSLESMGFLRDVKRRVNNALAEIILVDKQNAGKVDLLKRAYACFLRMNVSVEEIEKTLAWRYGRGSIPGAEALCQVFMSHVESKDLSYESSNWSGKSKKSGTLRAALKKCSESFPSLKTSVYTKKKKKSTPKATGDRNDDGSRKRPLGDDSSVQFLVEVPDGLAVGDKFETSVLLGNQMKTIRLTVPEGNPPKLKFSLKLPNESNEEPPDKRPKPDSTGELSLPTRTSEPPEPMNTEQGREDQS